MEKPVIIGAAGAAVALLVLGGGGYLIHSHVEAKKAEAAEAARLAAIDKACSTVEAAINKELPDLAKMAARTKRNIEVANDESMLALIRLQALSALQEDTLRSAEAVETFTALGEEYGDNCPDDARRAAYLKGKVKPVLDKLDQASKV